jgi:glutathione S-transferase
LGHPMVYFKWRALIYKYSSQPGFKAAIMLEELKEAYGIDYTAQLINIFQGVQKEPWFIEINPNGCIPVIVDHDNGGFPVMESTAILNYLAKTYDFGHRFHFEDPLEACTAEQWIIWHTSGIGELSCSYRLVQIY